MEDDNVTKRETNYSAQKIKNDKFDEKRVNKGKITTLVEKGGQWETLGYRLAEDFLKVENLWDKF